ncbi:MAG: hypothetical protein KDD60_03635 [Bdellovibrionales bacterium]|nr:hypothetical protein [Bdellovibrionales bacterium]
MPTQKPHSSSLSSNLEFTYKELPGIRFDGNSREFRELSHTIDAGLTQLEEKFLVGADLERWRSKMIQRLIAEDRSLSGEEFLTAVFKTLETARDHVVTGRAIAFIAGRLPPESEVPTDVRILFGLAATSGNVTLEQSVVAAYEVLCQKNCKFPSDEHKLFLDLKRSFPNS